jgi:tellurite methyltransferase
MGAAYDLLRHGIGDAGAQRRFDRARAMIAPKKTNDPIVLRAAPFVGLRDGVTEQLGGEPMLIGWVEMAFDEKQFLNFKVCHVRESQRVRVGEQGGGARITQQLRTYDEAGMRQFSHASMLHEDERGDYTIGASVVKLQREIVMSSVDAIKWNERYLSERFHGPREFLIEQAQYLPDRGVALDIATGLGGNAGFLLERGLRVIGVDVSEVGVRRAKDRWPSLMAAVIDLTHYRWPPYSCDVILNFYFCQRDLWPRFRSLLKPGGVLIMETLTIETLRVRPDYNPDYLLQPDELRRAFADWKVLVYREGWIEMQDHAARAVASLVARRPA